MSTESQNDRYIPAGVPPKGRPGAPADALEMQYDAVPVGIYTQNYQAVQPVDIAPGTASITFDLTLDSGAERTGTVLDQEGRPLAGASMIGGSWLWGENQRFLPLEGSDFTVYALSANPLVSRTVIFRHVGKGLGQGRCKSMPKTAPRSRSGSKGPPRSQGVSLTRPGNRPWESRFSYWA